MRSYYSAEDDVLLNPATFCRRCGREVMATNDIHGESMLVNGHTEWVMRRWESVLQPWSPRPSTLHAADYSTSGPHDCVPSLSIMCYVYR